MKISKFSRMLSILVAVMMLASMVSMDTVSVMAVGEGCTVSFNSMGGSDVESVTVPDGGGLVAKPADPTREGFTLLGWYKEEDLITPWDFDTDMAENQDFTLYAKWGKYVTVAFNSNDGSPVESILDAVEGFTIAKPVDPTKDDCVFDGWYKDVELTQLWDFDTDVVTEDITLYAKWTTDVETYTVTFEANGGSEVESIADVANGDKIDKPADPTKDDSVFDGWYKDVELTEPWDFDTDVVTENITLYAKWTNDTGTYTVTFESNDGSPVESILDAVEGLTITKPADPTREGFKFLGWYKEEELTTPWDFDTDLVGNQDFTLYAKWGKYVTVHFNSKGGSPVESILNVVEGSTIAKPANPTRESYLFLGWYKDEELTTPWNFNTDAAGNQDFTLYAQWLRKTTPFGIYGKLQVKTVDGVTYICDSRGDPVQLRGMSTYGLQWNGNWVLTDEAMEALAGDWKCDIIRAAMYVGEDGYAVNPVARLADVEKAIQLATKFGMYVLVDWHVHDPGNPWDIVYLNAGLDAANLPKMPAEFQAIKAAHPEWNGPQVFFAYIAEKYGHQGNILYEPANEPNGGSGSSSMNVSGTNYNCWTRANTGLKAYHDSILSVIRNYDATGIYVAGTPNWSQYPNIAQLTNSPVADPANPANPQVAYAIHFYTGTHTATERNRIGQAMNAGYAVFASEWGTSEASGGGGIFITGTNAAEVWLAYLDSYTVGWCNWSMATNGESSGAFHGSVSPTPPVGPEGVRAWPTGQLAPSGQYVRAKLRGENIPMYDDGELVTDFEDGSMFCEVSSNLAVRRETADGSYAARIASLSSTGPIENNKVMFNDIPGFFGYDFFYGIYGDIKLDVYLQASRVIGSDSDTAIRIKPIIVDQAGAKEIATRDVPLGDFENVGGGLLKATVRVPMGSGTGVNTNHNKIKDLILCMSLTDASAGSIVYLDNVGFFKYHNGENPVKIPDLGARGSFDKLPFEFESGTREGWYIHGGAIDPRRLTTGKAESTALQVYMKYRDYSTDSWADGVSLISPNFSAQYTSGQYWRNNIAAFAMDVYIEPGKATKGLFKLWVCNNNSGWYFLKDDKYPTLDPVNGGDLITNSEGKQLLKYHIVVPKSDMINGTQVPASALYFVLALTGTNTDYEGYIYYDNIGYLTPAEYEDYLNDTAEKYTVTFNSNGGSDVAPITNIKTGGAIARPANPTRAGYVFLGWYQDEALTTLWDFATATVTANITLYAKWSDPGTPFGIHGKLRVANDGPKFPGSVYSAESLGIYKIPASNTPTAVLRGQNNEIVQLRGMSTYGLQWNPHASAAWNENAIQALAKDWKSDVIRLAMYVAENGYATNPSVILKRLEDCIQWATNNGLYVMVDWHILHPGDPRDSIYMNAALDAVNLPKMPAAFQALKAAHPEWNGPQVFFAYIAQKYGHQGNIIYEPANEPNGEGYGDDYEGRFQIWENLKPYYDSIIEVIRQYDQDGIVICGTGQYCQYPDSMINNRINDPQVMYSMHWYTGMIFGKFWEIEPEFYNQIDNALAHGIPLFMTEWGTSRETGHVGPDIANTERLMEEYLDKYNIGWCNWSMASGEDSGAFTGTYQAPTLNPETGIYSWPANRLSYSGAYIRSLLRREEKPKYYIDSLITNLAPGSVLCEIYEGNANPALTVSSSTVGTANTAKLSGVTTSGYNSQVVFKNVNARYDTSVYLTLDVYISSLNTASGATAVQIKPVFIGADGSKKEAPPINIPMNSFSEVSGGGMYKASVQLPLNSLNAAPGAGARDIALQFNLGAGLSGSDIQIGNIRLGAWWDGDMHNHPSNAPLGKAVGLPYTFESATREGWISLNKIFSDPTKVTVGMAESNALMVNANFNANKDPSGWWDNTLSLWSDEHITMAPGNSASYWNNVGAFTLTLYTDDTKLTAGANNNTASSRLDIVTVFWGYPGWTDKVLSVDPIRGGELVTTPDGRTLRKNVVVIPVTIQELFANEGKADNAVKSLILNFCPINRFRYNGDFYLDDIGFMTKDEYTDWLARYTVTFEANGGSEVESITDLSKGRKINKPVDPTKEGSAFDGWYKDAALTEPWDFDTDVVTEDITLYAKWTLNTYAVTFEANGGSEVEAIPDAAHGDKIDKPVDPDKVGFTLDGWYKDVDLTEPWDFDTDVVTEAITLYAKWTLNTYTVTFEPNGGSEVEAIPDAAHGDTIDKPVDPAKVGFTLDGWYKDIELTEPWDFDVDVVTEDITLYAKWTINTYTVTFEANGGSEAESITDAAHGDTIDKPVDPAKVGFTFDGWYKDAELTEPWDFDADMVTEDITLYAKWRINIYTVTFNFNYTNAPASVNVQVENGKTVTKPANPTRPSLYTFVGWYADQLCRDGYQWNFNTAVTENVTLYAKWRYDASPEDGTGGGDTGTTTGSSANTGDTGNGESSVPNEELPEEAVPKAPVDVNPFDDDDGHWAEDYINSFYSHGFTSGIGNNKFGPDMKITRAQFVQLIANAFADEALTSTKTPFTDVPENEWYAKAVAWAASKGLVSGYSATTFGPNDLITRQDMATIFLHLIEKFDITVPDKVAKADFADDSAIASYAKDAVYKMMTGGIITGRPGNLFDPKNSATRAEAITMLYMVLEIAGKI